MYIEIIEKCLAILIVQTLKKELLTLAVSRPIVSEVYFNEQLSAEIMC